jgi:hypothetical protein
MANTVFKLRRSSVAGKKPTTSDIAIGEQAINLTDRILYSSDGTNVWEIGANNTIVNVTNSITVATNSITNSSGIFTNSINSASFKVGSAAFIANTSGVYTNNNINISYNDRGITFTPLSGGANVGFRQQSDDNFVFYSTNTTNGQRAIFNVYANTISGQGSAFRINVPLDIGSNPIYSNGSIGTNGQILTSNGSATYWATITGTGTVTSVGSGTGLTGGPITSSGTLSVNTGYNFTWSNIHTFQSNVAFTGNNISVVSNTGSILFGGASDQNWKIGRNTGATTKYYYTNNSLDIIAANSNLEGIVFGWTGNSYLETGYAGTFTRLPIYVGNSTVNVSINSTSFTGTANNSSYFGGNLPSYYTDATNITTGTLPYAQLGNNVVNTTGSFTLSGVTTFNANIVLGSSGISANGSYGSAGQSLLSNGSATYWATAGATLNANNTDTQTFYIGLSNASSGAWTNAVVSTTKLYYVPSTGKLDASIVNAASHTVGTAFTANSTVVNAVSYYAGTTLIGNTTGPYGKTESNLNVNNALTSNTATYLGNSSATVANVSSWITGNAATAYTNAVSYVDGLKLDSVTNTSITYIPVANTVKNAYDRAIDANTRAASAQSAAVSAYSNAVSYVDGKIATANSAITGNAATAYSNSVSYTDGKIATANSAITGNAATAYSNATVFASNASNINTGTLAEARLPYRMDQNVRTTDNVSFSSLTLTGSLSISGNVNVIGSNTLSIVDNFIYLNSNNTVDNEDLGIVGNYNTTGNSLGYAHSGIFRDASDGIWKVFDGYKPEPDANVNIDTTNTTFQLANFQANTLYLGNTSTNWLVANIGGMYHTGTVNAASHTVGTAFTANATVVNAVTYYVGSTLIGNSTGPYGKTEGSLNVNSALTSNNSTNLGGTAAASYQLNSTLNANIAAYLPVYTGVVNGSSHTVGTSLIANATGVYHTGTMNAASLTVGTSTIANSTGVYTGIINAASHTVGTAFTANSTLTNTVSLVVSTNTSTFGTAAYIVANGNVGIATSSPQSKLSIGAGSIADSALPVQISTSSNTGLSYFAVNRNGSYGALFGYDNGGTFAGVTIRNVVASGTSGDAICFAVNNTSEAMRILGSGNVGIGNTTPADKLVVGGNVMPGSDNAYNLGSATLRWANVFTGDLHLSNERTRGNDIDGTTGNWTIQEGETELFIINNKNGKKFKFKLEEVE